MTVTGSAYDRYLETEVLTADPLQLVQMLYRAALDSIAEARRRLADGDIAGRCRAVTRAVDILQELDRALDHAAGGELSRKLAELYDYAQRRLLEANFQQTDPPLAEVWSLLKTLLDGWEQCAPPPSTTTDREANAASVNYAG